LILLTVHIIAYQFNQVNQFNYINHSRNIRAKATMLTGLTARPSATSPDTRLQFFFTPAQMNKNFFISSGRSW